MTEVAPLNRTLEQELFAMLRGASLECLVCGEFVLYRRGEICCPECGMKVERDVGSVVSRPDVGLSAG